MVNRGCTFEMPDGLVCRAPAMRGQSHCYWHDPSRLEEATDARRLGGLHRRKATSVATVYDFAGLRTVEGAQRLLETAAIENLALENSIGRNRALIAAARMAPKLIENAELRAEEVPAAPLALRQPSHLPEHIRADAQSDRLAPALWLGTRVRRFRSLIEHPLFSAIYGRMVNGESPMRIAAWVQASVPPDDPFGSSQITYAALWRRLYRFRDALPPETVIVGGYIDRFASAEASLNVLNEFDTVIRLQRARISKMAEKEAGLSAPQEQVRREIETLGQLLARRLSVAIALGLHPGVVDPSRPVYVGGTTVQVNVGAPTPEARRYAQLLEERPDLVVSMTELFDRLDGIVEGNAVGGSTEPA
jgi:hypothetical protein